MIFESFGQNYDFVKVLPGKGIIYNNDSILLYKTNVQQLHKILKIKDTSNPDELIIRIWDGFDAETYNDVSGSDFVRNIKYKFITFEFADESNPKDLKLNRIIIKTDKYTKVYTDNGLIIGMINSDIESFFPKVSKNYKVSENKQIYNLHHYGISIYLEKMDNGDLKIVEIETYKKTE